MCKKLDKNSRQYTQLDMQGVVLEYFRKCFPKLDLAINWYISVQQLDAGLLQQSGVREVIKSLFDNISSLEKNRLEMVNELEKFGYSLTFS